MTFPRALLCVATAALVGGIGCSSAPGNTGPTGVTAANHQWFPITAGKTHELGKTTPADGVIGCDSCHLATSASFTDFSCTGCHFHAQPATDPLHNSVSAYVYTSQGCFSCHPAGEKIAFDHAGVTTGCAACHDTGNAFAALPVAGFTHIPIASDCSGCHDTTDWKHASAAPSNSFDPAQSKTVTGAIPTFNGPSITLLTPDDQILPMVMNHQATSIPAAALSACTNCHAAAGQGVYFPGALHSSLEALKVPQPTTCNDCHQRAAPQGFVGPLATTPARTPNSAEMRHDAVSWASGAPTSTALVTQDCGLCHLAPTDSLPATWSSDRAGSNPAVFHASLASNAQPGSCIDCHANSRPTGILTSGTAALPAGLAFDHGIVLGDCASCHASGGATEYTSWTKGVFHLAGSTSPATCVSCHEAERPTSTATWKSSTYTSTPFDYTGSSAGSVAHGDGLDCATCHSGPGTGAWGGTQNWAAGKFVHGPGTPSDSTCAACHSTQRPDLQPGTSAAAMNTLLGFDHSTSGTGDCFGCHQKTVVNGSYATFFSISAKNSGDWKGGVSYPGDTLAASPTHFLNLTATTLTRNSSKLVTSMSTGPLPQLTNAMLHTSVALPASFNAGPSGAPDNAKCHLCHVSATVFSGGLLHASLTDGGVPQPSSCLDCHVQMRPAHIVEKSSSILVPMDHSAAFTAPTVINGVTVTAVDTRVNADPKVAALGMECASCHSAPGNTWSDGKFHSKIGSAVPADCTTCHYPLMAAPSADLTAAAYAMKHRSTQLTTQACTLCHSTALAQAMGTPDAGQWKTGVLHPAVSAQPTACLDCHAANAPGGNTTSAVTYAFPLGGTASNGAQWMNHGVASVAGKDCAVCHAPDAKASGSAWSKSDSVHAHVTGLTTCNACHGLGNGSTVPGTNNNLPAGLTNSTTVTTSSAAAAGTLDQISHADVNASTPQCVLCHTQTGGGSGPPILGKEWAQAAFHKNFSAATPLTLNGTTGRCSNCHLNVKPGSAYAGQDHSAFTGTSAQDCNSCHAFPGTSATTPNWLGASGKPHGTSGTTVGSSFNCSTCHGPGGTASKHLSVPVASHYGGTTFGNTCVSCHIDYTSFGPTTATILYKHTGFSTTAATNCGLCHAFSGGTYTTLTTTPALGHPVSAGSHSFSQSFSVSGSFNGETFNQPHTSANLTNCSACHKYASTTPTTNIWAFSHRGTMSSASKSTGQGANGCSNCHEHQ